MSAATLETQLETNEGIWQVADDFHEAYGADLIMALSDVPARDPYGSEADHDIKVGRAVRAMWRKHLERKAK